MVEMRSLGNAGGGKVRKPPPSFTALIQHIPRLRRQQGNCDRILMNQSSEDKVRESGGKSLDGDYMDLRPEKGPGVSREYHGLNSHILDANNRTHTFLFQS